MAQVLEQDKLGFRKKFLMAGLWSALLSLVGMTITALALPSGAYSPAEVFLMSLGGGFAILYHLTLGFFLNGGRPMVISLTVLLWFILGTVLARFSKSPRLAMGVWIAIYLLCAGLSFMFLVLAVL
jgi:hypothetical protein